MKYKKVYIKVRESFSKAIDCCEFTFSNVEIEDAGHWLVLYDEDGTLAFKCHFQEIERFVKIK